MRVFTGMLMHESSRFSPITTSEENFREGEYFLGEEGEKLSSDPDDMILSYGGFVRMIEAAGHNVVRGAGFAAQPSAPLATADYERMRDRILNQIKQAMPVDAVMLFLHGAQLAFGYDDCEGDLLRRIRDIVGSNVIVGALLDLHGNLSDDMVEFSDILIACKEYPHTDFKERAKDLLRITEKAVSGEVKPVMARRYLPIIGTFHTTDSPLRDLVDQTMSTETGDILSISLWHGFQWSDTKEVGCNVSVVADGSRETAQRIADELTPKFEAAAKSVGKAFWLDIDQALDTAMAEPKGPVVIADTADNAGGGAPGDATFLLRAMLDRGIDNAAFGMIWDPITVQLAVRAGVGARLNMRIGGKIGPMSGDPIDAEVEVLAAREGATGFLTGGNDESVALRVEGVEVVVNSVRTQVFSPSVFTDLGIDVAKKKIVVVKSSQHFYAGFAPLASRILYCDTPGSLCADLSRLNFKRLSRPIWPLDGDDPVRV